MESCSVYAEGLGQCGVVRKDLEGAGGDIYDIHRSLSSTDWWVFLRPYEYHRDADEALIRMAD